MGSPIGHIVGMPCVLCSNAITDNGNGNGKRMNREETTATATPNDVHTTHNISLCTKTTKLIEKCSMRPNCVPMYNMYKGVLSTNKMKLLSEMVTAFLRCIQSSAEKLPKNGHNFEKNLHDKTFHFELNLSQKSCNYDDVP